MKSLFSFFNWFFTIDYNFWITYIKYGWPPTPISSLEKVILPPGTGFWEGIFPILFSLQMLSMFPDSSIKNKWGHFFSPFFTSLFLSFPGYFLDVVYFSEFSGVVSFVLIFQWFFPNLEYFSEFSPLFFQSFSIISEFFKQRKIKDFKKKSGS